MIRLSGCSFFSASSWWRARLIISSLCSWAKSPRSVTTPAGNLSLMRRQAAHSSSIGTFALRPPLPAPCVIEGPALRADRALMQLLPALVWIEDVILLSVSSDAAGRSWPQRSRIRLLHH